MVKVEDALKFPYNRIFKERLRLGTVELLSKIRNSGISLWIYTTSFRSEKYIKSLFKHYGIKIDHVINGQRHQNEVQQNRLEPMPSKYPAKYRIDLHVDDDISVAQNGKTYGFRVFLVNNDSVDWCADLWEEINRIRGGKAIT
jgi:hypothetical protein